MVRLVSLLVCLATIRDGFTEVQDVTTVFRFRETDVGNGFLPFDDCFGQTRFCPWYKSGWDVVNHKDPAGDHCRSNLNPKHLLPVQQLSAWIPIHSNHSALLTIKPKRSVHDIRVYLSADSDDGKEASHKSVVMLSLSSDGKHQAYACLGAQEIGEKMLIHSSPSAKISRKCSVIPDVFLPQTQSLSATRDGFIVYEFEFNSATGRLAVNAIRSKNNKPECESTPLIRGGYVSPVYIKYLRLISYNSEVRFSNGTPGLLLKDHYGLIVSRDIEVTPNASRLCLSISVKRNVFFTGLDVVVRARDGQQINFENPDATGVDLSSTWREIYLWNYVADLKDFENQTVDIQIFGNSYNKGNLFISGISQCGRLGGDHQMTIIHQSASLEIHGNVTGDNVPFLLPNYRVLGPNVGVPSDCVASQDGCLEWIGFDTTDWKKRSSTREKNAAARPGLQIGLQRFFDSIGGVLAEDSLNHQFVDGVNIIVQGIDEVVKYPILFQAVLWNEFDDFQTGDAYVLSKTLLSAGELSAPVLYKCGNDSGTESVRLTRDVTRNCEVLQTGTFSFTEIQELQLQIAVVEEDGLQIFKVFNHVDSTRENENNVLFAIDLSPINVTRYLLSSPQEEPVFATSYGIGSLFYSLEEESSEVLSPYFIVPEDGKICLAIDYFLEGAISDSPFQVKVIKSDETETNITRKSSKTKLGEWIHETVEGQIDSKTEVQIQVSFTKQSAARLLVQRLSFCHHEDNQRAIYEQQVKNPVAIFHPGARLATTNELQTPRGAKPAQLCWNGGVLVGTSCDCPAGFNGTECENGCGPNRYGNRCQHTCSYKTRGCKGMLMGRPYLGFNCAPGFGGPLCDTSCEARDTYGAGCLQKCGHCAENTTCDPFSGNCLHGCQPGWIQPLCQEEFAYLTTQPTVEDVTKDSATLVIDLQHRTTGSKVKFWQVQYKLADGIEWLNSKPKQNLTDKVTTVKHLLKDLLHDSQYQARIILLTKNPSQDYQGNKIIPVSFSTRCDEPTFQEYSLSARPSPSSAGLQVSWQYYPTLLGVCKIVAYEVHIKGGWRWNVYRYPVSTLAGPEVTITDLLPNHTYQLRIRAVTVAKSLPFSPIVTAMAKGSIVPTHVENLRTAPPEDGILPVLWNAPRLTTASGINYMVKYQCIARLACPTIECTHQKDWWQTGKMVANLPVGDLLAHARYRVWVRPVSKGEGGKEVLGKESSILFDTPAKTTTARPMVVQQNLAANTENSVTVEWGQPKLSECSALNGAFMGFHCEINPSPTAGPKYVDTARTLVTFGGLKPSTEYEVTVFVRTSEGFNKDSNIVIKVKTHSPSPGKVGSLTIYSKGVLEDKATLSLRWTQPREPPTVIDYYVVKYSNGRADIPPLRVPRNNTCDAWPDKICYKISELEFSDTYRVWVHAVSEDGKAGATTSAEADTDESLPGKPSFLRKVSSTEVSVTFEVGIPEMLNGALESFQVVATRYGSFQRLNKMFDVSNEGERNSYRLTLEKLNKNTKYAVHVRAMTMSGLGEEIVEDMETSK